MAEKNKIRLTQEDVDRRLQEKNQLLNVDREEALKQLSEARSHGDLSENSEYDDAKRKLAEIDAKIAEINFELSNYVLEESNNNIYDLEIENILSGKKKVIKGLSVGGSVEFDLSKQEIPLDSPLALAIKNAKQGDQVNYKVGEITFRATILSIKEKK